MHISEKSKFNLANISYLPKLQKIVKQLSNRCEVSYDHALHEILANGALAASGKVTIESPEPKDEGRLSYCNNFFLLISESGEGKTPTQKYITEIFERKHKELRVQYRRRVEEYKEKLEEWKGEEKKKGRGASMMIKPVPPVSPDIIMGEGTKEGIYWQLRSGKIQVKGLVSDEAGEFFEGIGMQNGGNFKIMSFLNRIWSNTRITDTKVKYEDDGGTVEIEAGTCLTINFAMQSYMFYKHIPMESNKNIGYIARYLITRAEPLTGMRHILFPQDKGSTDIEELREYRENLATTLISNIKKCQNNDGRPTQAVKKVEPKAVKLYQEIKVALSTKQLAGGKYEAIGEMAQKGNWHLLRLVLIVDWIENGSMADYETMEISSNSLWGAWKILEYYLEQHIELTDPDNKVRSDAKEGAKKVIEWLKEFRKENKDVAYIGWRDFVLKCSAIRNVTTKEIRGEIIRELVELKYLEDYRKKENYTPPTVEVEVVEEGKIKKRLLKSYIKILDTPLHIPKLDITKSIDANDTGYFTNDKG